MWIINQELNPLKLDERAKQHTFVGYEEGPWAIKYYDAVKKTVKVSRKFRWPMWMNSPLAEHWFEGKKGDKGKSQPDLPEMQAQNGPKWNLTDKAEMRASKCLKGEKADIPAPENILMSSPSQQDDQETISLSINNNKNYRANEPKDIPCPSSAPGQTGSDRKEPDKNSHWASVEEVQDKDKIPGLSPVDDDDDDVINDITDCEKSALTAAAAIYTAFTEINICKWQGSEVAQRSDELTWVAWMGKGHPETTQQAGLPCFRESN